MDWINIEDENPEGVRFVLVCDKNGEMLVAAITDIKKYHGGYCADTELHWFPKLTHWRELPKSPN